jgi:hypothetical protein
MSISLSVHPESNTPASTTPGSIQLLAAAPKVKFNKSAVQVSGVRGATGRGVSFTITNTGTSTIVLGNDAISFSGTDAAQFSVVSGSLPRNIGVGKKATFTVVLKATSNAPVTRVLTATLNIKQSGATSAFASLAVRGLATTGEGADKEPSLARILELFQYQTNVGDSTPDTTFLDIPEGATTDQLTAPRFTKAANGYVTITPLAQYVNRTTTIASRIGTYEPGTPDTRKILFDLPGIDSQTVNPAANGSTSFDPGTRQFSLWAEFPTFVEDQQVRAVFQEEALNTFEPNAANRNKVRVYPLKEKGVVVPNAYIVTFEEYTLQNDQNDQVFIIRNVAVSKSQPELGLIALDGQPDSNRLAFNRIENEDADYDNAVHNYSTIRIVNSGNKDLVISSLTIEETTQNVFQITSAPARPITLHRNSTIDVTVRFNSQSGDIKKGLLRLVTNDRDEPVKDIVLSGFWQSDPELNSQSLTQEPSLQELFETFGFRTQALFSGQEMDGDGKTEAIGDEVLADAWMAADPTKPVFVRELAGFHTQGNSDEIGWYAIGHPYYGSTDIRNPGPELNGPRNALFATNKADGQSLFPRRANSVSFARSEFTPGTTPIGFRVAGEFSEDSLNTVPPGDLGGHHFRFYPARDENNNFIPDAWLVSMDFSSINFDYNDHLLFIQNLKPADATAAVTGLFGVAAPEGNRFDWADTPGATGYAVFRANKSGGPYVRIAEELLTDSSFTDTKAPAGSTRYYRFVAVSSAGKFSTPANQGVTRAPA